MRGGICTLKTQTPPIYGTTTSFSSSINHIEEGMQFLLDGKELDISSEESLTPVDVMQLITEDFNVLV